MKLLREDGTVEFEGTPAECGIYCRKRDELEDKKNKSLNIVKENEVKESSNYLSLFSNFVFID